MKMFAESRNGNKGLKSPSRSNWMWLKHGLTEMNLLASETWQLKLQDVHWYLYLAGCPLLSVPLSTKRIVGEEYHPSPILSSAVGGLLRPLLTGKPLL